MQDVTDVNTGVYAPIHRGINLSTIAHYKQVGHTLKNLIRPPSFWANGKSQILSDKPYKNLLLRRSSFSNFDWHECIKFWGLSVYYRVSY